MIVYIGGVSGVGKTTIIESVEKLAMANNLKIERATVKEILCDLAGVKTVEEYRCLPEEIRSSLHSEATNRIYEIDCINSKTVRLYDGHFCSLNPYNGNEIVRPIRFDDRKHLVAIIVLIANPEVIFRRRIFDFNMRKDRHIVDVDFITREQQREIEVAQIYERNINIPLYILKNEGNISEINNEIFNLIKDIIKKET